MATLKFTEGHEWIRIEGDVGTVGITACAQEQLGDVVFVELPEAGRKVEKGKDMAVVESVKAASEAFAPASGEVVDANAALADDHAKVNADPQSSEEHTSELQSLMRISYGVLCLTKNKTS